MTTSEDSSNSSGPVRTRTRRRTGDDPSRGRETDPGPAEEDRARRRDDGEVEDAIARGGTRRAAKRGWSTPRRAVSGVPEEIRRALIEGPPRTMLVTAGPDRTQIGVMEDRTLVEHYVTRAEDVTYVGNIYLGRVQNVLPGMEAAFVNIGKGRNGVLYAGEVLYDDLDVEEGSGRIEDALSPGQTVLVQVTKDPMGSKGPRLTMHLSLAGRYTVLAPNSTVFGISRKLTDDERSRLRGIIREARPKGHGVIVRTAAEGVDDEALEADLDRLLDRWDRIQEAVPDAEPLTAVYEEPPLVVKVIRDTFGADYEACIIDDVALYERVRDYLAEVAPELIPKLQLYGRAKLEWEARQAGEEGPDPQRQFSPLFDAYNVTEQLRKALSRKVWLPSGGYLIIEATEAMKVIDVNTGKFTGSAKSNLEEIVLKTNLEAAKEIVRQLRLRDIGGIIIIDFIDMLLPANQEQVVRTLERELLRDRTKTRVSDVSSLGLVQMTRKNVSQGLVESFSRACEACDGRGYVTELE